MVSITPSPRTKSVRFRLGQRRGGSAGGALHEAWLHTHRSRVGGVEGDLDPADVRAPECLDPSDVPYPLAGPVDEWMVVNEPVRVAVNEDHGAVVRPGLVGEGGQERVEAVDAPAGAIPGGDCEPRVGVDRDNDGGCALASGDLEALEQPGAVGFVSGSVLRLGRPPVVGSARGALLLASGSAMWLLLLPTTWSDTKSTDSTRQRPFSG